MGNLTVKIPFVTWRNGRPRFSPGPAHRRLGLAGEDLRHPDGNWFSFEEARAWSESLVLRIAALKSAAPRPRGSGPWTIGQMFAHWFADPRMNGRPLVEGKKRRPPLAVNTVRGYKGSARLLERWDHGFFWALPANAVTARSLGREIDEIWKAHGLAQARAVRAALSAAYGWAGQKGRIARNPVADIDLKLPVLPPRLRVAEPEHIIALIAAADALGRPEIGDAICLGVWSGQRQNDRLGLTDEQISHAGILWRQHKKAGAPLLIGEAPLWEVRSKAARRRRAGWRVNYPHVILDEATRRPFGADHYRHEFARIRDAAVAGIPHPELVEGPRPELSAPPHPEPAEHVSKHEGRGRLTTPPHPELVEGRGGRNEPDWLVPPCPALAGFRDQDLRDTAVTWLARAGCSIPEICAITGHSLQSANSVLKHYLGLHPELAATALGKLADWYAIHIEKGEER